MPGRVERLCRAEASAVARMEAAIPGPWEELSWQRPTASGPVSERTPAPLRLARYEAAVVGQMNVLQFAKNVRESSEIISVADQIVPSAAATEAL